MIDPVAAAGRTWPRKAGVAAAGALALALGARAGWEIGLWPLRHWVQGGRQAELAADAALAWTFGGLALLAGAVSLARAAGTIDLYRSRIAAPALAGLLLGLAALQVRLYGGSIGTLVSVFLGVCFLAGHGVGLVPGLLLRWLRERRHPRSRRRELEERR